MNPLRLLARFDGHRLDYMNDLPILAALCQGLGAAHRRKPHSRVNPLLVALGVLLLALVGDVGASASRTQRLLFSTTAERPERQTMTAWQKIIAGGIIGVLWLAAIISKHFWTDIDTGAFQLACGAALSALGIHSASTGNAGSQFAQMPMPTLPPGQQTGFVSLRMMAVIAAVALGLSMLGGCTTTTGAMYRGYATEAKAGIQTWDDNSLATMHDLLCAQPYSAIQRHPEFQPGVVALCGPLVNTASLDPRRCSRCCRSRRRSASFLRRPQLPHPARSEQVPHDARLSGDGRVRRAVDAARPSCV
jgi:hypothetical protein